MIIEYYAYWRDLRPPGRSFGTNPWCRVGLLSMDEISLVWNPMMAVAWDRDCGHWDWQEMPTLYGPTEGPTESYMFPPRILKHPFIRTSYDYDRILTFLDGSWQLSGNHSYNTKRW